MTHQQDRSAGLASEHSTEKTTDARKWATEWWRSAIVYQIYVRSFADGDGDGTGDIAGIRDRLPYLTQLGIDAIWINPWYRSPLHDGGYDVADYRNIDPRYGTIDDAEALIAETRELGIRVIVDLVPNHTSSNHPWFDEALNASPGSPERSRYHFTPGRGAQGTMPPNDWRSVFGGPAWTRVADGEWYLHLFDQTQPDLNWDNSEVRAEFDSILRFWLDRGVAGFRVDVAHGLVKAPGYPDLGDRYGSDGPEWLEGHPFWDRDELHEIIERWRSVLDEYDDRMMVAEAWVRSDRRNRYVRANEYHQAFDFDFLKAPWDAEAFRSAIENAIRQTQSTGSSNTWVLENHDVIRSVTRYALPQDIDLERWLLNGDRALLDVSVGTRRARAAALVMLSLPGSAYIYQGEELGLPEVHSLAADVLDDPVWRNSNQQRKGRDGCRVPIPWSIAGPSFGFGPGQPWLPQPDSFGEFSVEAQQGRDTSNLELYRSAIRARRTWMDPDASVIVTKTGETLNIARSDGITCVINMGRQVVRITTGEVLLASGHVQHDALGPNDAAWVRNRSGLTRATTTATSG